MGKTNGKSAAPGDVLELATGGEGPRRRVSIDGQLFDMVSLRAMSVFGAERARQTFEHYDALVKRAAEILATDPELLTPEMEAEFDAYTLKVLKTIVPGAPAALLTKLPDLQRMEILRFFIETTASPKPRPAPSTRQRHLRRGSRGSTAAARASG